MPARLDCIKVHVPEFGVLGGNWVTKLVKEPRIYATKSMKAEFIMKAVEMVIRQYSLSFIKRNDTEFSFSRFSFQLF